MALVGASEVIEPHLLITQVSKLRPSKAQAPAQGHAGEQPVSRAREGSNPECANHPCNLVSQRQEKEGTGQEEDAAGEVPLVWFNIPTIEVVQW